MSHKFDIIGKQKQYNIGVAVAHLKPLVETTYQGDTHRNSVALKQRRIDGPHAELTKLKTEYSNNRGLSTDGSLVEELYEAAYIPIHCPVCYSSDAGASRECR